jgi:hypothetical protein
MYLSSRVCLYYPNDEYGNSDVRVREWEFITLPYLLE